MPDTITLSSPIQTVTVGSGISPDQSLFEGLAGFTAGREFHPAPKIVHHQLHIQFAIIIADCY